MSAKYLLVFETHIGALNVMVTEVGNGEYNLIQPIDCEVKLEVFETTWNKIADANDKLTSSVNRYVLVKTALKRRIAEIEPRPAPLSPHNRTVADNSAVRPQLPIIQPPKFNGELLECQSFKNKFSSVVNKDGVNEVDKMHYLLQSLQSTAYSLVANVEITDAAFATAWQTLTTRYENKRVLITAQLNKLFSIPKMASRAAKEVNNVINTTSEVLNALKALGSPVDYWDHLIVHYITQKLDPQTREDWEITLGAATDFPTYDRIKSFLLARARALEAMEGRLPAKPRDPKANKRSASGSKPTHGSKTSSAHVHMASSTSQNITMATGPSPTSQSPPGQTAGAPLRPKGPCSCCDEAYFIVSCPTFQNLPPNERHQRVISRSLCFNCLGPHPFQNCRNQKRCRFCQAAHHSMLHDSTLLSSSSTQATIVSPTHHPRTVRLLIDPGSELTLISLQLARQLDMKPSKTRIPIVGVGSVPSGSTKGAVDITLRSSHSDDQIQLHAHVLQSLTIELPSVVITSQSWTHIADLELADPDHLSPGPIDILIGADSYGSIIKPGVIAGNPGQPIAIQTVFGWAILGPAGPSSITAPAHQGHLISTSQLHELVSRFWEQEEVPASHQESFSAEEAECEAHFIATHSRDSSGRYIVRLPFKSNAPSLGYSKGIAQRSLSRILNRIAHQPNLQRLYTEFLNEYESLGHMKKVQSPTASADVYYLPHHGVMRNDKIRVVFNSSSKTSSGYSFNELLHVGPKTQNDIFDVLLYVRRYRLIFTTDVEKMFRQIFVHPHDRKFQRILWIDDNSQTQEFII
ncbi:uncharacterized protein LOC141537907 [Cotesia typhae]|uniref:uncharacterized protein LOC141537907 n=1 Tax=Cotesia typhae TaxID=2053667 RepID=UPI003D699532